MMKGLKQLSCLLLAWTLGCEDRKAKLEVVQQVAPDPAAAEQNDAEPVQNIQVGELPFAFVQVCPRALANRASVEETYTVKAILASFDVATCSRALERIMADATLDLSRRLIIDISPLSGLPPHIKTLRLDNNLIESVEALKSTYVEDLNLDANSLKSIEPLVGSGIKVLAIGLNPIEDLSPLDRIPLLEEVRLFKNDMLGKPIVIKSPSMRRVSLENVKNTNFNSMILPPQLESLSIYNSREIVSIPDLSAYPALKVLNIRDTTISDLSSLAQAPQLQRLNLENVPVSNLTPVHGLLNLDQFVFSTTDASVIDFTFLRDLKKLTILRVYNPGINDLFLFADLKELEVLWLDSPNLTNYVALASLPKLKSLEVSGTPLNATATIAALTALEDFYCHRCGLTSMTFLAGLKQLRVLALSNNPISSFETLRGLSNMEKLTLGGYTATDFSPLRSLSKITHLNLSGQVPAFADIPNPTGIRGLYLYNSPLSSLQGIQSLAALEELGLDGSPVSDLAPLASMRIRVLTVNRTGVTSLEAIKGMKELAAIEFRDTTVSTLAKVPSLRLTRIVGGGTALGGTVAKTEENCPQVGRIPHVFKIFCTTP